jgi:DNA-directed RNA polymerase specialized sigma subunit
MTKPSGVGSYRDRDSEILSLASAVRYYADRISRLPWVRVSRDDLIQEGWLAALRAGQRYDKSKGCKFTTYLKYRIKGAMLDAAEAERLRASRELQTRHLVRCNVPVVTGVWRLVSYLAALPVSQRRVLYLHYIEGRSLREISKALSIHPSRVYQLKTAGIRVLRRNLGRATAHSQ